MLYGVAEGMYKREIADHSEATVQPPSHAEHSNVLCKGWASGEEPKGLFSHAGHLKHTHTHIHTKGPNALSARDP